MFKGRNPWRFQVGAQAYNVLNHINFAQPNNDASNLSTLGQISGDINAPTSPYGSSQQPTVSVHVLVVQGRLVFYETRRLAVRAASPPSQ